MSQPLTISVSNLEYFRTWRTDEEADLDALLRHLRGEEPQTEAMKAGEALHKALQNANPTDEVPNLVADGYHFYVQCEATIELPELREHRIEKQYGDLLVRGRVDGQDANRITDYKTTSYFDPDRFLEGYQWRLYLDMAECDWFAWKVFVLKEFGDTVTQTLSPMTADIITHTYEITQFHELSQHRYEGMAEDCHRLAADYLDFVRQIGEEKVKRVYAGSK